jgi:hypothetical protein
VESLVLRQPLRDLGVICRRDLCKSSQ